MQTGTRKIVQTFFWVVRLYEAYVEDSSLKILQCGMSMTLNLIDLVFWSKIAAVLFSLVGLLGRQKNNGHKNLILGRIVCYYYVRYMFFVRNNIFL